MSAVETPASTTVRAAGALCWRRDGGGSGSGGSGTGPLLVLLVHRPRYDDWSFPKGKLDRGEVDVVAAVREVEEETGLSVRLGVPLPTARYRLSDTDDKQVTYWAARLTSPALPAPPHPDEVDDARWFTTGEAAERLTRRGDRMQLQALVAAEAAGALDTWPLVVVRHAQAHPRGSWDDDTQRTLNDGGQRQARALRTLLEAWGPTRVYSSPWARCVQTVQPYVEASGATLHALDRLSELGHRGDPRRVAALVTSLFAVGEPVAVCTHRPVLSTVLGALAGHASAGMTGTVPRRDPFLEDGEVLVAHVSRSSGRVVAVERHPPRPLERNRPL